MKSQIFVKKQLEEVLRNFPNCVIRYEFDEAINCHFIEVTPKDLFESSKFIDYQIEIHTKFSEEFPFENISFVEENGYNFRKPHIACLADSVNDFCHLETQYSLPSVVSPKVDISKVGALNLDFIKGYKFEFPDDFAQPLRYNNTISSILVCDVETYYSKKNAVVPTEDNHLVSVRPENVILNL